MAITRPSESLVSAGRNGARAPIVTLASLRQVSENVDPATQ
jgi:hypothetical protein